MLRDPRTEDVKPSDMDIANWTIRSDQSDDRFFMEIQWFEADDGQIKIKELCVLQAGSANKVVYYLFQSTSKTQTTRDAMINRFQTRHHHHLKWVEEAEEVRFCPNCIFHYIKRRFPGCEHGQFYVMDHDPNSRKIVILRKLFPKLDIVSYPTSLDDLPEMLPSWPKCPTREHGIHCAFTICVRLNMDYMCL